MTPIFKASCQSGKLVFENRGAFDRYLWNLKAGPLEVIVRPAKARRSNSQNRFYWGILIPLLVEWSGHSGEEVHMGLKLKFLTERDGDGLEVPRSTSDLSVTEFTKYIERCQQFAAENGVYVPDPGEVVA